MISQAHRRDASSICAMLLRITSSRGTGGCVLLEDRVALVTGAGERHRQGDRRALRARGRADRRLRPSASRARSSQRSSRQAPVALSVDGDVAIRRPSSVRGASSARAASTSSSTAPACARSATSTRCPPDGVGERDRDQSQRHVLLLPVRRAADARRRAEAAIVNLSSVGGLIGLAHRPPTRRRSTASSA